MKSTYEQPELEEVKRPHSSDCHGYATSADVVLANEPSQSPSFTAS